MLRLLLGIVIGVYFSDPIEAFLDSTGISQEIEQQYIRYRTNQARENKTNLLETEEAEMQQ